jgi:hypothetical protein
VYLFSFEVILFFLGAWTLISGKISARLVGAGTDQVRGRPIRLVGILLMLPVIFEFLLDGLRKLVGDAYYWYFLGFQMVFVAAVLIGASVLIRRGLRIARQTRARDEIKEVE